MAQGQGQGHRGKLGKKDSLLLPTPQFPPRECCQAILSLPVIKDGHVFKIPIHLALKFP